MSIKYFCISILFLGLNNSSSFAQTVEERRQAIHEAASMNQDQNQKIYQLNESLFRWETAIEEENISAIKLIKSEISLLMEAILLQNKGQQQQNEKGQILVKQFNEIKLLGDTTNNWNLLKKIPQEFLLLF